MELLTEMSDEQIPHPVPIHIAKRNSHVRRRRTHRVESQSALRGFFGEGAVASIQKKPVWSPVVRAKDIRPAVAIKVRAHQSQRYARHARETAHLSAILQPRSGAGYRGDVAPKTSDRPSERLRRTEILPALNVMTNISWVVIDVVANNEVEPPIAIKIQKTRRRRPARIVEPGFLRDFAKLSGAKILKEPHCAVLGHEQIR